jgi:hypothetical protein
VFVRFIVVVFTLVACAAWPAAAQSRVAKPAPQAPDAVMTNQDVAKLAKAGFSDELILSAISGASKTSFNLSPDGLLALKSAGVSEAVIGAMFRSVAPSKPSLPEAEAAPQPTLHTESHSPREDIASDRADIVPPEVGLYVREDGKLRELRPEIVNWRTGGFLKRMVTAGLAGGHLNGWITSPRSPNAVRLPTQIVIYTPQGTSVTEYQLLRCDEKSTRREFRIMSTSVVGARSGAEANAIEFASEKVAARTYLIRLENLPPGEYGFLPPGLAASSMAAGGKIYSFSVK